jgi:hypothetical protein
VSGLSVYLDMLGERASIKAVGAILLRDFKALTNQ